MSQTGGLSGIFCLDPYSPSLRQAKAILRSVTSVRRLSVYVNYDAIPCVRRENYSYHNVLQWVSLKKELKL